MHLNILTQCSPSPQFKGLWRHPDDRSATGYRTLDYWMDMARKLDAACIDALFFADAHGLYDVYRSSWAPAVQHAVQTPSIDPVLVLSAVAAATRSLGFAVTYSTTYHTPYECARVFSSLDHLTGGRIAWNIVTSYLRSASANGLGEELPHDQRYDRADEFVAVARALWEQSWDEDAIVRDAGRDVFTDPAKVREIAHEGRWFRVRGPHQCEPSPQRTPVLYQAGASHRGTTFAARHAEVLFMTLPDPENGAEQVRQIRRTAEALGRPAGALKILQAGFVLVGRTREETRAKAELVSALSSAEGEIAKWCGWMGFDLAAWPADAAIAEIPTEASRSVLDQLYRLDRTKRWTVGDVRAMVLLSRRPHRRVGWLFGTPGEIADRMERWMGSGAIDGFNLIPCPSTTGIDDICDLLIPELQRRGLFRTSYDPAERTLRERYFGAGHAHYTGATHEGATAC